ncbi:MAG: nucleoside triphosphate pyrophosphatase [Arenicellales bacterium]|nr:nucleoside triphosphate pyrophosphatase [Arenicellales bacterium]
MSKIKQLPALVLASSSPYRRQLLSQLGLSFKVHHPDIDESTIPGETARELVSRLATQKALAISADAQGGLIIGSDQVAVQGDKIEGKPRDRQDAIRQLSEASGREITLQTGLALLNSTSGRVQVDVIPYKVRFRKLTLPQIEAYLDVEVPFGCCGSLRADGLGIALLESLTGDDPSALIGLPLIRLVEMLESEGVRVIPEPDSIKA